VISLVAIRYATHYTDTRFHSAHSGSSVQVVAVRLVNGFDGKPKGYGYVEFSDLESLKTGIAKNGSQVAGRTIRVGVAEARA
jgi:RNA recognition motif-containing protein